MFITPDPQESYVQAAPLLAALKPVLAEEEVQALETKIVFGFLRLQHGGADSVTMKLDEVLVALVVSIPSVNKKQQALRVRQQFDPSTRVITTPSTLSAYLNVRGSQEYLERAFPGETPGRKPFRMTTDGAVNLHGWVFEGSADYLEQDAMPWARGDVRLVHDFPDAAIRVAAGDLSYPVEGFQSFQSMLGVTVARNFELQPYRITEPTGQTSFFLKSSSRVEVLVNGQLVRILQLEPGPYNIRDFPVVSGNNDVTLKITDATGRTETKTLSIVSDINLLTRGLHKYAYSVGVVSRIDARKKIYDSDQPVLSAFHRYGLSNEVTLGGNLQASSAQQLIGFDASFGQNWGVIRADVAASRIADVGNGSAWRLQYQNVDNARAQRSDVFRKTASFALLASYRDRNFAPLGSLLPNNSAAYELAARYGWQASPTLSLGVSGNYRTYRDNLPQDSGINLSLNQRLTGGFQVGVNLGHSRAEGTGVFLSLTWTEPSSRQAVNSSYDSLTHTARADWSYAQDGRADSVSASSGIVRTERGTAANGNIAYFGNRGELAARHDIATTRGESSTTESRSQFRFGTALVYGDGMMALSRPVSNSFALFVPSAAIEDYLIGINPRGRTDKSTTYEAKTDGASPAVIPDLTPYYYRTFRVDASRLPPGFDAGESVYTLYPNYRSGTVVRLGSDANVLLDGTLQFQDGTPVALQAGSVRPVADPDALPQTFFTNRSGRFRIEKLKPGRYFMQLFRFPATPLSFDIPEHAAGPTAIGSLVLPVSPEPQ